MFFKRPAYQYIIAGLGNPGPKYNGTRHNTGFAALKEISERFGAKNEREKFKSQTAETVIAGKRVLLLRPMTFMNLSGEALSAAAGFYKLPPENIIVISDDVSLPAGTVRLRAKGSAGGHNGLRSIIACLSSEDFPRLKIGVGSPEPGRDMADFVLSGFAPQEKKAVEEACQKAPDIIAAIIADGVEKAMSRYNGKRS